MAMLDGEEFSVTGQIVLNRLGFPILFIVVGFMLMVGGGIGWLLGQETRLPRPFGFPSRYHGVGSTYIYQYPIRPTPSVDINQLDDFDSSFDSNRGIHRCTSAHHDGLSRSISRYEWTPLDGCGRL